MSIRNHIKNLYFSSTGALSRFTDWVLYLRTNRIAAVFLKKHPQPELTASEKQEIDRYWQQYGIRFKEYSWFQMYYGVTGIHDPSFIPDSIARSAIYRYYNDAASIPGWDDKNLYETILPDTRFPRTFAHIYNGDLYDRNWKYHSPEKVNLLAHEIYDAMDESKDYVVKVSKGSYAGQGVRLFHADTAEDIGKTLLENKDGNFIVQERLCQSDFMNQFCSTSVNIFRIITWKHQGEVKVLSSSIRFGIEGRFTDVNFINGEEIVNVVGLTPDGAVNDRYISFAGRTGLSFDLQQRVAPNFDAVIAMAKKGHERLFPFGIVGWDITLDQNNEPICIEYNVRVPGTILYQYANGPYGGPHTEAFMAFLLEEKNQKKYIPKRQRIN
jgi:hypothetical protein